MRRSDSSPARVALPATALHRRYRLAREQLAYAKAQWKDQQQVYRLTRRRVRAYRHEVYKARAEEGRRSSLSGVGLPETTCGAGAASVLWLSGPMVPLARTGEGGDQGRVEVIDNGGGGEGDTDLR